MEVVEVGARKKVINKKKRTREEYEVDDPPAVLPVCSSASINNNANNHLPKDENFHPSSKIIKRLDPKTEEQLPVGRKILLRLKGDSKKLYSARIYMKESFGVYAKLIGGKKIDINEEKADKFLAQWKGETSTEGHILDIIHEVL